MRRKLDIKGKTICAVTAALLIAGSGFMGVNKYMPEKRTIMITDETAAVSTVSAEAAVEADSNLKIKGKAAVLIDGSSGKVIFEQNSKKHLPPASVTKVMTLLLIMEGCENNKISLDDQVTISENAAGMGGSQMYMEPGEQHTAEELIKGIIMVSANDGCVAMAEHLYGSVESFVDAMNRRAQELGLENSHFVNTNGLPVADHYSCAYDIGIISMKLMKYDEMRKWFTSWQEEIKVGLPGKEKPFTLTNTNKLIRTYNGAIGVKTGYTDDAGYCLSGAAERDGTRMIGVVLGCKTSDIRFAEMAKLLDYGFANYETVKIAEKGQIMKKVKLEKSDKTIVGAVAEEYIGATVKKGEKSKIRTSLEINSNIKMPLKKGNPVGKVSVYNGKEKTGEYRLISDRNAESAGFMTIYTRMMGEII